MVQDQIKSFFKQIREEEYPVLQKQFSTKTLLSYLWERFQGYAKKTGQLPDEYGREDFTKDVYELYGLWIERKVVGDSGCGPIIKRYMDAGCSYTTIMLAFLVSRYYVYRKLNKRKKKKTEKGYDDSLYRYVRKAVFGEYNEVYDDVKPAEIKFFESEDRFNETLSQLSKMETPTFLRTLFFRGQSGLLAAERTIHLSVLDNMPDECKRVLLVNPNPELVSDLATDEVLNNPGVKVSLLFFSREIAEIYCRDEIWRKKISEFYFYDDKPKEIEKPDPETDYIKTPISIKEVKNKTFDLVIMIGHVNKYESLKQFITDLDNIMSTNTRLDYFLPQTWLDSDHDLRTLICSNSIVDYIKIIPSDALAYPSDRKDKRVKRSKVFKKYVRIIGHVGKATDYDFNISRMFYAMTDKDTKDGYLIEEPWILRTNIGAFLAEKRGNSENSMTQLYDNALSKRTPSDSRKVKSFNISKEIEIWYSWSEGCGRGRFGYYGLPSLQILRKNRLKRGKLLFKKPIEIRAKTESRAINNIKKRVLRDEKIWETIAEDILDKYYFEDEPCVSFLTYWLCRRNEIKDRTNYDDDCMMEILLKSDIIANMMSNEEVKNDKLIIELQKQIKMKRYEDVYRYLRQINVVIKEANNEGLFVEQDLSEHLKSLTEKNKGLRDARKALVKKTYTHEEEQIIVKYLKDRFKETGDSKYLGALICFYTGCSIFEVAALEEKDYHSISGLKQHQLYIYKRVNPEGKIGGIDVRQKEKYRRIPIVRELDALLYPYKKAFGEEKEDTTDEPEPYGNKKRVKKSHPLLKTDKKDEFIDPEEIRKAKIEAEKAIGKDIKLGFAKLSGEEKTTNFDSYNGDRFKTNLRYRLLQTCVMTRSETNYIMGLVQEDTYAKHYCDFANDFSQIALKNKMERWSCGIDIPGDDMPLERPVKQKKMRAGNKIIISGDPYKQKTVIQLDLPKRKRNETTASITVNDDRGIDISIDIIEDMT